MAGTFLRPYFLLNISTTTSGTARSRRMPVAVLVVFSKVSYSHESAVSTVRTAAGPLV